MVRRHRNRGHHSGGFFVTVGRYWPLVCACIVVLFGFSMCSAYYNTTDTVRATVLGKERINNSGGSSYYLVFTDRGEFKNSDDLLLGKFDSSTTYGTLEIGKSYEFDVVGWRVPFFSMYPNIAEVRK